MLMSAAAIAAPKKKPPKKPVEPPKVTACETFAACQKQLLEAFESTDYEQAQRLAVRAEALASTSEEKAERLVVVGALDAQSLGLSATTRETVKRRFSEALRLVPSMLFTTIPAFARTDELEALFDEARAEVAPRPAVVPEKLAEPVPVVVVPPPPPPAVKKFPVGAVLFGGLALAGVGVFTGASVSSLRQQELLRAEDTGPRNDLRLIGHWNEANTMGWLGVGGLIGAGVFTIATVIALLVAE